MDAIKQINEHRSIRKYKNVSVSDKKLNLILNAALRASSSGNMQTMSIVVTRDEKKKNQLYEYHYSQKMILQAPLLLTFCADWNRMIKWCKLSEAHPGYDNFHSFMVGTGDAFIAAQNAVLAAESLGLGVCYMGTTMCNLKKIATLLKCPKNVVPITTLVVGYPDEDVNIRDRLPLESIVHYESYHDFFDEDIRKAYNKREEAGWKRYMESPELKEKVSGAGVKNLAQVYTKLKYLIENNKKFSRDFLDFLKEQDFMNNE